ncbi:MULTISPECIES: hypothetical protein [Photorhabdus]|uniref:hypothetical protein n=1 Tax=Photorhabdus TaxID=29487 RepID=UPI0013140477|nr:MULTISPECIES: hypothetical protein [Photorhabdus]NDK95205.1 hypothetical protein [Photorhabdus laumondii subsp. laumondii]NDL50112.1 hypothetical protein [Photorhabdus laumondii subsp. laumondii]
MTGVSECSQQRGNLKDNGYIPFISVYSLLQRDKTEWHHQIFNTPIQEMKNVYSNRE